MAFDIDEFLSDEAQDEPVLTDSSGFDINTFLNEQAVPQQGQIAQGDFSEDVPPYPYVQPTPVENAQQPEPGFQNQAIGALEAAATMGTGATTGALGYIYGAARGLLNRALGDATPEEVQQMAEEYQQLLTYLPDTPEGQQYVQAIGEALDWVPPVAVAGMQMPIRSAAQGSMQAAPPIRNIPQVAQQEVIPAARQAVTNLREGAVNTVRNLNPMSDVKPDRSMGAAEVRLARLRQERANELPINPELTKGQLTQDLDQQKIEREWAKTPLGKDLRNRFNEQNETMLGNIDAFIDDTGTTIGDISPAETGGVISRALDNQVKAEKAKINKAYKIADKTPEAKVMVNTDPLTDFLNENSALANQGTIWQTVQKELWRENYARGNLNNNNLDIDDMPVWRLERLRQYVNKNFDRQDSRDRIAANEIKKAIDLSIGDAGGEPYAKARALRTKFGDIYEDRVLVRDLIATKPNTKDRKIALEAIADKSVNRSSKEDLVHLRSTLHRTEEGKEAFKELGAEILKDLKFNSLRGGAMDAAGNEMLSPTRLSKHINRLDKAGKLEILYGKKTAEQLKTLAEVAKDVYISQEGAVNYSNTATAMGVLLDVMLMQYSGAPILIPLRYGANKIRDRKIKKQIKEALNYDAGANQ